MRSKKDGRAKSEGESRTKMGNGREKSRLRTPYRAVVANDGAGGGSQIPRGMPKDVRRYAMIYTRPPATEDAALGTQSALVT